MGNAHGIRRLVTLTAMIGLALIGASTGAYATTGDMTPASATESPSPNPDSSASPLLRAGSGAQAGAAAPTASPSPLASNNPSPFKAVQPFNSKRADRPFRDSSPRDKSPQTRDSSSYTLTFEPDGGSLVSGSPALSQTVTSGHLASPPTVTKSGYLFDGWFLKGSDVAYDFGKPVTSAQSLTAHWSSVNDAQWTTADVSSGDTGGSAITLTPPKPRGVRFAQVSAGHDHTLAVGSDGHVYAWGDNSKGELGDSTTINKNTPVRITENEAIKGKTFISVSAGTTFSMALASDGTVYTWGDNSRGELGNGSTTNSSVPVKANLTANITAISAGYWHAMALSSSGTIYTWGDNEYGQLGNGHTGVNVNASPAAVSSSGVTFTTISAGYDFQTALDSQGHAYAWGRNQGGQLSIGTMDGTSSGSNVYTPSRIYGDSTGNPDSTVYTDIDAGYLHVLALSNTDKVYYWGYPLTKGNDANADSVHSFYPSPVSLPTGAATPVSASAGDYSSAVVDSAGSLYMFGSNSSGQLGDGTTSPKSTMTKVSLTGVTVTAFDVCRHSLAIGSDGLPYTWGEAKSGKLGQGSKGPQSGSQTKPAAVIPPQIDLAKVTFGRTDVAKTDSNSPISRTSAGDDAWSANTPWAVTTPHHTYGTTKIRINDGQWSIGGAAQQGQSIGNYTFTPTAQKITFDSDGGSSASDQFVTAGKQASRPTVTKAGFLFDGWFIKEADGSSNVAYDFSSPVTGPLNLKAHWSSSDMKWKTSDTLHGDDTGGSKITLTPPKPRAVRFAQASAGRYHTLAVGSDGHVYAWGNQASGGLGNSKSSGTATTPVRITENDAIKGKIFIAVSAGDAYSMALASDGTVYTWGSNSKGQLGNGTTDNSNEPVKAQTGDAKITAISAGRAYAMALASDGTVYTWGNNVQGQLGNGSSDKNSHSSPAKVTALSNITAISAGFTTGTALDSQGHAWAWGENSKGQLGNGALGDNPTPTRVQDLDTGQPDARFYIAISAGYQHVLALDTDHDLYGWGSGTAIGSTTDTNVSTRGSTAISFGSDPVNIIAISAGDDGSETVDDSGEIYTWGNEGYGQLGNGSNDSTAWQTSPKAITLAQSVKARAVSTSGHHQTAVGSDGLLYTWGYGYFGQLGRNGASSVPGTTQPPQITLTKVAFGTMASGTQPATNLTRTDKDTWDANRDWTFVTPTYPYGPSSFTITWTVADDTGDSRQTQQFDYTFDRTKKRITLDPEGGTGAAWTSKDIEEGELVPRQTLAKTGFLFDGWFVKADDGSSNVAYDFGKPVTDPLTLVAHWTPSAPTTVDPTVSPSTGGYQVTITPPSQRGIRFAQVSTGKNHTLAVGSDGNAYAWGNNSTGQLGNGSKDSSKTPVQVKKPSGAGTDFAYTQVSAGYGFSLALGSDGNAYAWGDNGRGQLGKGAADGTNTTPVQVKKPSGAGTDFAYTQVSAGGYHSLAVGKDHQAYAWGDRSNGGQVGDGNTTGNAPAPVAVNASATSPGFQARQVSAGYQHSLIIGISGQTYAWGYGASGRLGNNAKASQATPVSVSSPVKYEDGSIGFFATQVSAGGSHSLAIGRDGKAYAWGANTDGRLGTGDTNDAAIPTLVADPDGGSDGFKPTEISAGGWFCAGIDDKGKIYTWGNNGQNALGNVSITGSISTSPVLVSKNGSTIQISAGERQVLVIDSNDMAYGWGDNSSRQLGTNLDSTSVKAATLVCPPQLTISSVTVGTDPDTAAVLELTRSGTADAWGSWNTWTFYTPAFKAGRTTVNITWNVGQGNPQTENLPFTYKDILPLTGSQGLLIVLLVGLFITVTVLAARQHYLEMARQTLTSTR
ncbi:InlB B-repeat-containing protein [Bifidobacterium sp. H6bp9]|uniref:RCC1 domain-containing protein n=1 Tax=Bifidobacterium sp. H6bp9 TaxID=3051961 RepID=UPI0028BD4879|nr:InlB B-repeat-containing protein [Bifidobacterium sp. H6bp9]MDT7510603.1 InlB B-repeat-containing protein [Bifidobacterium sp. H6bp9]